MGRRPPLVRAVRHGADPVLHGDRRRRRRVRGALGALHEGLRSRSDRRRNGAVYTPAAVADRLVDQAFAGLEVPRAVCDPAAGGGAFLLAVARALREAGVSVEEIVGERLWGADIDSSAVAVARIAVLPLYPGLQCACWRGKASVTKTKCALTKA